MLPKEGIQLSRFRFLLTAATLAWTCTLLGLCIVAARYDALPDHVAMTRWTTVPKSPLVALRVPLLNLLSVALLTVLARAAHRNGRLDASAAALFMTAGSKAMLESLELAFDLPLVLPTLVVVLGGVALAAWLASAWWRDGGRGLSLGPSEKGTALVLVALLVLLSALVPVVGA